jgi:hypothetical protein
MPVNAVFAEDVRRPAAPDEGSRRIIRDGATAIAIPVSQGGRGVEHILRRWRSFEAKSFEQRRHVASHLRVAIAKEAQIVEVLGPRELFCLGNSLGETFP